MKLKRYVRYLYEFEEGKPKFIINDLPSGDYGIGKVGDILDDIYVKTHSVKTADTLLELAQVGDEIVYKTPHSKYESKKDEIIILHDEYIECKYMMVNRFDEMVLELWVRQDSETFKRYEVE